MTWAEAAMKRAWDWSEVLVLMLGVGLVGGFMAAIVLLPG
jgi:hypothetical protein